MDSYILQIRQGKDGGGKGALVKHEHASCLRTSPMEITLFVMENDCKYIVRRITPIEGERLQGFADGWTRPCFTEEMITDELVDRFIDIHAHWNEINGNADAKRKTREQMRKWLLTISSDECPDGPRYKCIGNSMSVNVMMWIGQRIELEERYIKRNRS